MPILTDPYRWAHKPPLGSEIDRGNFWGAAAQGLWAFNEGGGSTVYDLARSIGNLVAFVGIPAWASVPAPNASGPAMDFSGSAVAVRVLPGTAGISSVQQLATDFVCLEAIFSPRNVTTNQIVAAAGPGDVRFFVTTAGKIQVDVANRNSLAVGSVAIGGWYHLLMRSVPGATDLFINGVKFAIGSSTNAITYTAGTDFEVASRSPGGLYLNGQVAKVAWYHAAPTDSQVLGLYADPWQMVLPPVDRRAFAKAEAAAATGATAGTFGGPAGEFGWRGRGWNGPVPALGY